MRVVKTSRPPAGHGPGSNVGCLLGWGGSTARGFAAPTPSVLTLLAGIQKGAEGQPVSAPGRLGPRLAACKSRQ